MDTSALSYVSEAPPAVKAGIGLATGAGILAAVYMFTNNTKVVMIVALGMFAVMLLLAVAT